MIGGVRLECGIPGMQRMSHADWVALIQFAAYELETGNYPSLRQLARLTGRHPDSNFPDIWRTRMIKKGYVKSSAGGLRGAHKFRAHANYSLDPEVKFFLTRMGLPKLTPESIEAAAGTGPDHTANPRAKRKCLGCGRMFDSSWIGHRRCESCKSNSSSSGDWMACASVPSGRVSK